MEFDIAHSAWSVSAVMLVPALLLLAIVGAAGAEPPRWPLSDYRASYLTGAGAPLAAALWLWTFYANFTHDGSSAPLPYLPLLNAIDLGNALAGLAIGGWVLRRRRDGVEPLVPEGLAWTLATAAVFIWLNAILLRTLHHWADIPYRLQPLMASVLVQASLSIFWTVLALATMFTATRKHWREVWMAGAALMAVVVLKLFLVDLSHIGGIERIVSFLGVGVLMLVIGYFSPVPPRIAAPEPAAGAAGPAETAP